MFSHFMILAVWLIEVTLVHSNAVPVEYNVFYPRSCVGSECSLGIRWSEGNDSNWINFTLMARTMGEGVWAAVGFSDNDRMSNSDVIACWYQNNKYELYNAWNSDYSHKCIIDDNQDIVMFHSGNYTEGLLTCHFSRMKVLNVTTKKDISLDTKWHILLAWGHLVSPTVGSPIMLQHGVQYSTGCTCNVSNTSELCLCINEFKQLLLNLHGTIMSFVYVFFLPAGAFIAAFYKHILGDRWFQSHVTLMVAGTIGMIIGLGLILGHTGGTFYVGPHQIIGCVTLGFTMIQVLMAMFRPAKSQSLHRKLFEYFHRMNGVLVMVLGYLSLFLGSWLLLSNQKTIFVWMEVILGVSIVCSVLFIVVVIIVSKCQFCKAKEPPVRYHRVSDVTDAEEEEVSLRVDDVSTLQFSKERTLLIGFFLQSFTLAGLITAFVFYNRDRDLDI